MYVAEREKQKHGLPVKWSHPEFIHGLIMNMMGYEKSTNKQTFEQALSTTTSTSRTSSTTRTSRTRRAGDDKDGRESEDKGNKDNFNCKSGVTAVLKKYKPASLMQSRMRWKTSSNASGIGWSIFSVLSV
jgi:hypothetical protein